MALTRYFQKIFGKNSQGIGQFGSAINNTKVTSTNIETLQSLSNYEAGWESAVITNKNYPSYQEMNGLFYSLSYQLAYMFENGIPEYDNQTEYKTGSFVKKVGTSELYESLIDGNINQPLTNVNAWKKFNAGGGLEVGDIGIAIFPIDETQGKRRYLNGTILTIDTNSQAFINKLKQVLVLYPNLGCTEAEWQGIASSSIGGQCGKFVLNETAGTLRLPKIVMPIQGIYDLAHLGDIVEAGLPNLKGTVWGNEMSETLNCTGVFYQAGNAGAPPAGGEGTNRIIGFEASRYNDIYSDNVTTVQQEQIQFPYYIQIATGQETEVNIINEIELNNPYNLFDIKYSEHALYNASWLLSDGQYNTHSLYPSAYEALLVEQNPNVTAGTTVTLPTAQISYTKKGMTNVKLYGDSSITDYDFVINSSDNTFKLPTKTHLASGEAVVGNGMVLGLTDGTSTAGLSNRTLADAHQLYAKKGLEGNLVGTADNFGANFLPNLTGTGVTTDGTKSGIETDSTGLYLYYYVGETVQNANLVNIGRIAEDLSNKVDTSSLVEVKVVIETYVNGNSGYRIWSDGYCEQWGYSIGLTKNANSSISLLKTLANSNVNILLTPQGNASDNYYDEDFWVTTITTTSFSVFNSDTVSLNIYWKVSGYLAEGEY